MAVSQITANKLRNFVFEHMTPSEVVTLAGILGEIAREAKSQTTQEVASSMMRVIGA